MRLIICFFIFSFSAYADGLESFEKYKENFPLLLNDISRMEEVVKKNNAPLYQEMLTSMVLIKNQYDHLSNPLNLKSFHDDSAEKGWRNIERMSGALISTCESRDSKNNILCQNGLEEIKTLTQNSKLSDDNKEAVIVFIDDYLLQLNAMKNLNEDFISHFNQNAESINKKIKESANKIPKIVVKVKPVSGLVISAPSISFEKINYYILALFVFVFSYIFFFVLNISRNRIINKFYTSLFTVGKKNNLYLKVYGKLLAGDSKLVNKFQMSLLNTVNLSRGISNKAHIKFKTQADNLIVEVNFFSVRAIQTVTSIPKEKLLKESLVTLQEVVESLGGEFVFTNRFDSMGELVQSSLLLQLPK